MQRTTTFYDTYHKKNADYRRGITEGNFTYFYLAPLLRRVAEAIGSPLVLDVGCGVGTLSLFISQYARSVWGIDVSERALNIAEKARVASGVTNVSFKKSELQKAVILFQLIVCCEVLEHVPAEKEFLTLLNKNLQENGVLILSSPLSETILAGTALYKKFDAEVGHLRRYTSEELTQKIRAAGFDIIRVYKTESLLRNLLFILHLDVLIKCIRGPLVPVFHWFDERLVTIFGASNCIVVARKR